MATCGDALGALLAVWDDTLRTLMEVLEQKGGIVLKNGILHIPDYFQDRLSGRAPDRRARGVDDQSPPAP
jgi:hypothetical protein